MLSNSLQTPAKNLTEDCILRCADHRPFLEITKNQGEDTTRLVQCNRCRLVFEDPRPLREAINRFYANQELWTRTQDAEGNPRSYVQEIEKKRPFFRDLVRRIERRKRVGSLLDVGCGPGILETELDRKRWDVLGVEPAEFIARFGREQFGVRIISQPFESVDFEDRSFDVVVLKYALDHMENPFAVLNKVRRLIKPDGLLVIADLINIDSFCACFFKEGHRLFHPMHFTYFSPETIRTHLERLGFRVVGVDFPFFRTPYCNLLGMITFIQRVLMRTAQKLGAFTGQRIFSTAFYGNMMDVWAVPV